MTRVAAIDCGTNTIRLLIAEADRDDFGRPRLEVLRRRNEIVRLGQGVDRTGLLDPEALERQLEARRRDLLAELADIQRRLRLLDTAQARLRKDDSTMEYTVNRKTLPQRQAACLRMTIPAYDREGDLWHLMMKETAPLHLQPDDPCYCSVVFHDGEYKERDVDVEAQKTVRGTYPDTEHVTFRTLPPVTFASTTFQGPYDKIGEANTAVAAWIRDNGYTYAGPSFNIYHVSPHETDNPEEFITEVCYPIQKP